MLLLVAVPVSAWAEGTDDPVLTLDHLEATILNRLMDEGVGENVQIEHVRLKEMGTSISHTLVGLKQDYPDVNLELTRFSVNNVSERYEGEVLLGDKVWLLYGKYEEVIDIPALLRTMQRGEVIGKDDIQWVSYPARRLRRSTMMHEQVMVGKQLKRRVIAGRPVYRKDVMSPLLIERGDTVSLIYRNSHMEIKTSGRAMDNGAEGEIVRIKNEDSGKIITAQVQANGELIVNYNDGGDNDV